MNKSILIVFCFSLFLACQPEDQLPSQIGQFTSVSNFAEYLDVGKIRTVIDFDEAYQEKSKNNGQFRFLLPYDFEKKRITTQKIGQSGIPIMGTPPICLMACCRYNDVLIEVSQDQKHLIENFEFVNKISLKKWIPLQILNNGKDPEYSITPQRAIFTLAFDRDQPLTDADLLLYQIVESYEEFLKERANVEQVDIKLVKEKYPLNLLFEIKSPLFLPQTNIVDEVEITDEELINAELEPILRK